MTQIYPVLLAGGSGKRLWPLSRKSYPKQFCKILNDKTLFQQSALRLTSSDKINFQPPIVVANSDFRFIVGEQLQEVGIDPGHILIEPEAKNTGPAVLVSSLFAKSLKEDAILLVAPSDHILSDVKEFHETIKKGLESVYDNKIVTLGINATHPETGFGYLELDVDELKTNIATVNRFIEKPNFTEAQRMIDRGGYLWNAGIFLFRADNMINTCEAVAPKTVSIVEEALKSGKSDLGFLRLNSQSWKKLDNISIDYLVMEKADNLVAVHYLSGWSDLGGWQNVWAESNKDDGGNVLSEGADAIDCKNTLLRSEHEGQHIVGLGLTDIVAISMRDAVLIAKKDKSQNVREVVDHLKSKNIPQAEIFPKDYRPWGWFEVLTEGRCFKVKRICVKPSAALSLQSHEYRSEHWIVVEGSAKVIIGDTSKIVNPGQSAFVPCGAKHSLANPGKILMIIIEVQIGTYLGEDDITRYEDLYQRT